MNDLEKRPFQLQQLLFCWIGCPLIGTLPVDFFAVGWFPTLHIIDSLLSSVLKVYQHIMKAYASFRLQRGRKLDSDYHTGTWRISLGCCKRYRYYVFGWILAYAEKIPLCLFYIRENDLSPHIIWESDLTPKHGLI